MAIILPCIRVHKRKGADNIDVGVGVGIGNGESGPTPSPGITISSPKSPITFTITPIPPFFGFGINWDFFFGKTHIEIQKEAIQAYLTIVFKVLEKWYGFPIRDGHALQFKSDGVRRQLALRPDLGAMAQALWADADEIITGAFGYQKSGSGIRERFVNQFLANAAINNWTLQATLDVWDALVIASTCADKPAPPPKVTSKPPPPGLTQAQGDAICGRIRQLSSSGLPIPDDLMPYLDYYEDCILPLNTDDALPLPPPAPLIVNRETPLSESQRAWAVKIRQDLYRTSQQVSVLQRQFNNFAQTTKEALWQQHLRSEVRAADAYYQNRADWQMAPLYPAVQGPPASWLQPPDPNHPQVLEIPPAKQFPKTPGPQTRDIPGLQERLDDLQQQITNCCSRLDTWIGTIPNLIADAIRQYDQGVVQPALQKIRDECCQPPPEPGNPGPEDVCQEGRDKWGRMAECWHEANGQNPYPIDEDIAARPTPAERTLDFDQGVSTQPSGPFVDFRLAADNAFLAAVKGQWTRPTNSFAPKLRNWVYQNPAPEVGL